MPAHIHNCFGKCNQKFLEGQQKTLKRPGEDEPQFPPLWQSGCRVVPPCGFVTPACLGGDCPSFFTGDRVSGRFSPGCVLVAESALQGHLTPECMLLTTMLCCLLARKKMYRLQNLGSFHCTMLASCPGILTVHPPPPPKKKLPIHTIYYIYRHPRQCL